jgi:hypothetical protein
VGLVAAALIVAAAVLWAGYHIASEIRSATQEQLRRQALSVAQMFAPAIAAAQADPKTILTYQPLARTLRVLMPEALAALDRAAGAAFPFTTERIQAAHAQWTADWLSWERAHDAEYKARAAEAHGSPARADQIEREKLETYQRRYEEYIRVARALQSLITP